MHWNRLILAGIVTIVTLVTLTGAFAWYPQQMMLSNPYPLQTAQYRAYSPYTTAYMGTGFSPLGTTAYAPSYGWTSAYTTRAVRPVPMDSFGPRVTPFYDNAVVFAPRREDPTFRGAYDPWTGMHVNQFTRTIQAPVVPANTRLTPPAMRYPSPSYVQSGWGGWNAGQWNTGMW